jgi:hypothetical protein
VFLQGNAQLAGALLDLVAVHCLRNKG